MDKLAWLLLVPLVWMCGGDVSSSPLKGPYIILRKDAKIPEAINPANPGTYVLQEKFRGGQRACVIVEGDHKPVVDLEIVVYDVKNRMVAHDKGDGDIIAAIWYPPRDAEYKIEIRNPGQDYNAVYVVVK